MSQSPVVSVRMSQREKTLVQSAAERSKSSVSEYIRRKALESAEEDLMMNRNIIIPAEKWAEFEAQLNAPSKENKAVKELLSRTPQWQS